MAQSEQGYIAEIGQKLKAAEVCISLAAELLSRPGALSSLSIVEIYRLEKRLRSARNELFPTGYFADVAWDILVDLFLADDEHRKLSIADLSARNDVPLSTLLRYLAKMEEDGLVYRTPDHHDKRRVFIKLTSAAEQKLQHVANDAQPHFPKPDPVGSSTSAVDPWR